MVYHHHHQQHNLFAGNNYCSHFVDNCSVVIENVKILSTSSTDSKKFSSSIYVHGPCGPTLN
ncbi:hypothetical protein DERP_008196 [Dermatophagoides pteronyssinus]|uniref:Uncharacterized protein n=1 Tax=Dermatophagoides pteronyssinus TaxID=6956 RepID=A0ABQ8JJZ4_DERPT|nr:hypothetical protein DERP_008196 [Dermatophagoides pteronyssinus]